MTREEQVQLIDTLYWNLSEEVHEQALKQIRECDDYDLNLLIMPRRDGRYWKYAAKAIVQLDYSRTKGIVSHLFVWFQDLNWTGAREILEYLLGFPMPEFQEYYEDAIRKAMASKDECWLDYLSYYTYKGKCKKEDFSDEILYEIMLKHQREQWSSEI